jgi:hypothetical protein
MIGRQRQGQDRSARRGFARRWLLLASTALVCGLAGVMAVAALATPADRTLPFVEGNISAGGRVFCETGTWSEVSKFKFTWVREGEVITGKQAQPGLEGYPSLTLEPEDEGYQIWCIVTGEGGGEKTQAESSNSVEFGIPKGKVEKPVPVSPPEVSGEGKLGARLECSQGHWSGSTPITYTYSWRRNGTEIPSQTGTSYEVTSADEGHTLNCRVTAKNSGGEAFQESSNSVTVKGKPPKLVEGKPPKVEGIGGVGETLTCNHGEWTGTAEITYSYEWLLGGASISGALGSTLVVEASYEGKSVACKVTATNSVGKETAPSAEIKIGLKAPEDITRPAISGGKTEGSSLTCGHGEWTGTPSYKYRWYRQLESGEEELSSKTEGYKVVKADVGHALFCVVTAENSEFRQGAAVRSEAFVIPASGGEAPKDIGLPVISSAGGKGLSCSEGQWKGSPANFEYQWVRDAKTAHEVDIANATHSTYTVQSADEGHTLTCDVTATNSFGSGLAASEPLSITGRAPVPTEAPSIIGTPRNNETLTCERGEWEGSQPIEYTYSWLRNGVSTGVTGYAYTVHAADLGQLVTCVVSAKNGVGPGEARSPELYVPGGAPEAIEAPTITGSAQVNEELTCSEGKWHGAPLTPSFEWLLNGVAIAGATQKNFKVVTVDRGLQLVCRVTETNKEGHASADSAAIRVAGVSPNNVLAPSISGSPSLGATLTCEHGLWEGAPPPSFSYQWTREGALIGGATGATYTIEPADQGHLLACIVTATNVQGSSQAESTNAVAVAKHKVEEGSSEVLHDVESTTPGHPKPSVTAVRDAFLSQLPHELAEAKLKNVRKSSSYSLGFTAAGAGEFELEWYVNLPAPHKHLRKVVVARGAALTYTKGARLTMHLALTKEGKRLLKNARRIKLHAEASFKIAGGSTVTWSETFTLH